MIGATLPNKELLTSGAALDGFVHAFYPSASKTLCCKDVPKRVAGRPGPPTCEPCMGVALAFHSVDSSCPASWLGPLTGEWGQAA